MIAEMTDQERAAVNEVWCLASRFRGEELNTLRLDGSSLLYTAVAGYRLRCVSALLAWGADETLAEPTGLLPQDATALDDPSDPLRLMLRRGPAFRATSWAWPPPASFNSRSRAQRLRTRVRIYTKSRSQSQSQSPRWRTRLYDIRLQGKRAAADAERHAADVDALVDERICSSTNQK